MHITVASSNVLRHAEIAASLAAPSQVGRRLLPSIRAITALRGIPLNILEECAASGDPEAHDRDGDLWHCLEGAVTFTCGGKLVSAWTPSRPDGTPEPHERKGKGIAGGEDIVLHAGDWLWIPAGVPHMHAAVGTTRLIIVKIPCVV